MLSSENPPPDPPCSSQISPSKIVSSSCCDDRNNPLPNFSIRDYVSSSRDKDITNNWPFSQKNLQFCLKYGVKDVLPPFDESLHSAENPTVKKCRLTVKPSKANEQTPNQGLISGKMAGSKVCPVCKTFSSSSNTTLNAHIDQCLSWESKAKPTATASSKVIKQRIKQRKTRLMKDVYKTALHCTLEDLDRRNGTNWASNFGVPGQDSEAHSPVNVNEDINIEGSDYVCIDSNGTKVRVLSKLADLPSGSDGGYNCGPSKVMSKKKNNLFRKQKLLNPGLKVNEGQKNNAEVAVDVTQSKQTALREDINHGHGSQDLDKLKTTSRIKINVSSLGDRLVKRFSSTKVDKIPLLATESHKRNKPRKNSLSKARDCRDGNDCPELISKFNVEESRNDNPSVDHELHVDPSNDSSVFRSFMPSEHHTFSSEGKRFISTGKRLSGRSISSISKNFASLRKKLLSVKHASVAESKKKMRRKHLDFKKRRMHSISGSEEEDVGTHRENEAQMEHATSKSSIINKAGIFETKKKREGFVNAGKIGDVSLKRPNQSPESDSRDGVRKNVDSLTRDGFVCEPSYDVVDRKAFVAFSRSLNSNIGECFPPHYSSHHDVAEMDADDARRNYFVDIDPIQIPGPPDSFLPSPGRMGSEELQGISSLTTCKIQSSEDEREVVDIGSLDSPISAMSVVSNSFAPISRHQHFRQTVPENNPTPNTARYSSMGYAHSEARFTCEGDCDSPTKSTSNPVLRLMGKNLMVAVNKDENPSPQTSRGTCFGVDNDPHYFHPTPSVRENNFNLSDGFQVPSNFRSPQFPSKNFGERFSSSPEYRECENIEKVWNFIPNPNSVDSLGSKQKEVMHDGGSTVKAAHVINNPFYCSGYPICASGSQDIRYKNTRMPFSKAECSSAVRPKSLSTGASVLPNTVTCLKPSLYLFPHHGYSRT